MEFENNREFGSWGEKKAAQYLLKKGFRIVERNFRLRQGEIDIIVTKDDWLVFVEVKTRSSRFFGSPQAAVDFDKQRKIKNIARYFLMDSDYKRYRIRFDVISIMYIEGKTKIEHLKNCF